MNLILVTRRTINENWLINVWFYFLLTILMIHDTIVINDGSVLAIGESMLLRWFGGRLDPPSPALRRRRLKEFVFEISSGFSFLMIQLPIPIKTRAKVISNADKTPTIIPIETEPLSPIVFNPSTRISQWVPVHPSLQEHPGLGWSLGTQELQIPEFTQK